MCTKLGIDSHLHALRHYSATELLTAGVDLRTVAGRLGHGGGGATTLRVYAAWVSSADRQAAEILGGRMKRPDRHLNRADLIGSRIELPQLPAGTD
jgi:integrase